MSDDVRYGYSLLTDTWYKVTEWEDMSDKAGPGKIRAKSKEEIPREKVPEEYIEATEEQDEYQMS